MNDSLRDPPRWKDRTDQGDVAERAAGHAFRCAAAEPPRAAPPLARVAARLRGSRRPIRLVWAVTATAFILGLATAASAAHFNLLPAWLLDIMKPGTAIPSREGARLPQAVARTSPSSPAAVAEPAPPALPATPRTPDPRVAAPVAEEAPPTPPARAPSAAGRAATAPRKLVSVEGNPSAGARTSASGAAPAPDVGKYLSETIHLLRKERMPAAALRLLDGHEPELAKAGFGHEALILRVEALLALGRRAEALRVLDSASLTDVAASRVLLITRGELRAAANRCTDGLADFDLVLARSKQLDRQALIGRALCRKKLGDLAGARADIQRLREQFPNDRLPAELER